MKDLDFDELDRAVNSLVTKKPDNSSQTTAVPLSNQTSNVITPAAVRSVAPSPDTRRNSGRFMDVVHPSSDMRPSSVTVEPRPTQVNPIVQNKQEESAPVSPAINYTKQPEKQVSNDWPDPIDFHESKQKEEQHTDESEDEDIDKISNEITNSLSKMPEESLESPFLSGTKVEKRPLGAFSNELPVSDSKLESEIKNNEKPDEKIKDTQLPAELQNNILMIEADSSTHPEKNIDSNTQSVNTRPEATSINQQYTEKPSSSNQNTGAIYDTSSYHKNLVRPPKKKSGWMLVFWIFLLLIIGTGAGVAVYFLVLAR